jgi:hypothetical protein
MLQRTHPTLIKIMAMALFAMPASHVVAATSVGTVDRSWNTVMKWPDLTNGMWQVKRSGPPTDEAWSFTASAQAIMAASPEAKAAQQGFKPCAPFSPFDIFTAAHPLKFFYTKGEMLIMSDGDNLAVRRVFMDGGAHDNIDPSYAGRSFGRWDGNTLVIETTDFDQLAKLSPGLSATSSTRLSERYRLIDANNIEMTATITDATLLAKPHTFKMNYTRRANWDLQITTCIGSNREEPGESGELKLNLTPPQ